MITKKIERLIEKCATIKPLEKRILVAPEKIRTYKHTHPVLDDKKNIGKDPLKDEMATKVIEEDINYRFQKAVVLQKADDETRFNIGDTIVYNVGSLVEFDLFKGVSILRAYDVVAVLAE